MTTTRPWWAFWWDWPSLLVEFISGFLVVSALIWIPVPAVWSPHFVVSVRYTVAQGLSVWYEARWDRNGWSSSDVAQRTTGIVAALLFWFWVFA